MGAGTLLLALSLGITHHAEAAAVDGHGVRERFTPAQLVLLQKLNRADLSHLDRLASLIVPDLWVDDELAYSPMPRHYPNASRYRRLVIVHPPTQAFGAYEHGVLVRWGPVSTGARTAPTPSGLFYLNWKKREHTSTINPDWSMPWAFNFDNRLGLAFHEQALPGKPASHACVRLLAVDAQWLFEWGEPWTVDPGGTRVLRLGTPVLVIGEYNFEAQPPWQSLHRLARPVELPPQ